MNIAHFILIASALLLAGVLASKLSSAVGVPSLLLFIVIGMLAGSEGVGGIPFEDADVAMFVGFVALCLILFDGGLQTRLADMDRELVTRAVILSSLGVVLTAAVVGVTSVLVLGMSWPQGLLIGAILSSTDAAAVFSVLRARNMGLPQRLRSLIEFESASNDPTAVFLTVSIVAVVQGAGISPVYLPFEYLFRLAGGVAVGWVAGRVLSVALNRISLEQEGLYPVLTLASIGIVFGAAELIGTSGFMAAYVTGLALGSRTFVHKASLTRFHNGLAWLMQIAMFLILGLLVFPSQLVANAVPAIILSVVLVTVARPLAVFTSLALSGFSFREKLLVSWVGLRGAAPIILATIPLVVGLDGSDSVFAIVFFAVVISVLVQGPTVGLAARLLGLAQAHSPESVSPFELTTPQESGVQHARLVVERDSVADGHRLLSIGGPGLPLVVMIRRDNVLFVPTGSTRVHAGDELFVIGDVESIDRMRAPISKDESVKQGD